MGPITTPLATWFPDAAALAARRLSFARRRPILFPARDRAWRGLAPSFDQVVTLTEVGLPFQIAAERTYDRTGRAGHLRPALGAGKTVFLPQVHQVLPRVMRLVVALRAAFMGPGGEECSFLFLVEGRGREGLGLHHDGEVHAFWLQLEGRRTVTLGRPVPRGTPQDLPDDGHGRDRPWRSNDLRGDFTTQALPPGSLLYLPPRTPHRVVCHERSLALSLTWSKRSGPRSARSRAEALTAWDVASGRVTAIPAVSRTRLWTQVPVAPVQAPPRRLTLALPDGGRADVPRSARRIVTALGMMASFPRDALGDALPALVAHGIVGPQNLPLVVVPDAPASLDGWRFA